MMKDTLYELVNLTLSDLNTMNREYCEHSNDLVDEGAHSLPPVDLDGLLKRTMGNVEFMLVLLAEFEGTGIRQVDEIALLTANDDFEAVSAAAHSLKGATSIIGAKVASSLAAQIEKVCTTGPFEELFPLITQLRREIERCLEQLAEYRKHQ